MSKVGQHLKGPIFIDGSLTVSGNINKGALTVAKDWKVALGIVTEVLALNPPDGAASVGTATPATLTMLTPQGYYDSIRIRWTEQRNLRWLDHYELQVSSDNATWYALRDDGVDWKGTLNAVTSATDATYLHDNIPFGGSSGNPTAVTLYYRVRQVTVAGTVGSWSSGSSGIASPIEGLSQIKALSIVGGNIAANTISTDKLVADEVNFIQSIGSQGHATPQQGDLRAYNTNPIRKVVTGEKGYINIDQYAGDGSGWQQRYGINPSSAPGAPDNMLDAFNSGRVFANDALLSAPGRFFFKATNNPFTTTSIFTLAYGNGVVLAAGQSGKLARSTDGGITWGSLITVPWGTSTVNSLAYGNGVFIAACAGGKIARSTDGGVTWGSLITNPFGTSSCLAVAYGGGCFVVVAATGKIARSTDDGVTWGSLITNPLGASVLYGIEYGNGVFIIVANSGTIFRSTDLGLTWSNSISNPMGAVLIHSIAYGDGVFVAVGGSGEIARSIDGGITWGNLISNPFGSSTIYHVTYGIGIFLAVTDDGKIARSLDLGVSWGIKYGDSTTSTLVDTALYAAISTNNGRFVVAGFDSTQVSILYTDYVEAGAGIVESGSNSNGSYVMFADGTVDIGVYFSVAGNASSFQSGTTTLPISLVGFISGVMVCQDDFNGISSNGAYKVCFNPGLTSITWGVESIIGVGATYKRYINIAIKGKWK